MQQGRIVLRLMIICMTLIVLMWITRGSLCELRITSWATRKLPPFWLTNPKGKATQRRGHCSRLLVVCALIHEHPSNKNKNGEHQARRFHTRYAGLFQAGSIAQQGCFVGRFPREVLTAEVAVGGSFAVDRLQQVHHLDQAVWAQIEELAHQQRQLFGRDFLGTEGFHHD